MTDRPTVAALRALKGKRQILTMHVDNAAEAAAGAEAGLDMYTCELDATLPGVRAAAPGVFLQAGSPQGLLAGPETAIREGFKAIGASCSEDDGHASARTGDGGGGTDAARGAGDADGLALEACLGHA